MLTHEVETSKASKGTVLEEVGARVLAHANNTEQVDEGASQHASWRPGAPQSRFGETISVARRTYH